MATDLFNPISGITPSQLSQPFTRGTSVATTSGTAIDFTSIPSWVKRITLIFNGVSTSGVAYPRIQIGSGSVSTSGYLATSSSIGNGPASTISSTGGIDLFSNTAVYTINGQAVFTNISGNIWIGTMVGDYGGTIAATFTAIGSITLGGTLDRIRLTTSNGTDTFDAGSVNIFYE